MAMHIPSYEAQVREMTDDQLSEALSGCKDVLARTPRPTQYNEWYMAFHILRTETRRRLALASLDSLKASAEGRD